MFLQRSDHGCLFIAVYSVWFENSIRGNGEKLKSKLEKKKQNCHFLQMT